jgi:hypothetical protein
MRIAQIETLHADGCWHNFDFVKLTTAIGAGTAGCAEPVTER